jgi:hypothetical protein
VLCRADRLAGLAVPHGVIAPGYPETPEQVQIASVQSLVRRLDRHSDYGLIVIDEAHQSIAGTLRRAIEQHTLGQWLEQSTMENASSFARTRDLFANWRTCNEECNLRPGSEKIFSETTHGGQMSPP